MEEAERPVSRDAEHIWSPGETEKEDWVEVC